MTEITPSLNFTKLPAPGIGVGLRSPHVKEILTTKPNINFFELLTDNHLAEGGYAREQAYAIRQNYPVTMHSVGMSFGGTDPIDFIYLSKIKKLANELEPLCISDHLCWTSFEKHHANDLLPLPYTEEAVYHASGRITKIQEFLETTLVVENVSSYLTYKCSDMNEWEFLIAVAEESNCKILLDLNNIYVSQYNNQIDANEYINNIPLKLVAEIHLAGFENKGTYLLDAHNNKVSSPVWELYQEVMKKDNTIPTLIEWDNDLPPLSTLLQEAEKAREFKLSVNNSVNKNIQNEPCAT